MNIDKLEFSSQSKLLETIATLKKAMETDFNNTIAASKLSSSIKSSLNFLTITNNSALTNITDKTALSIVNHFRARYQRLIKLEAFINRLPKVGISFEDRNADFKSSLQDFYSIPSSTYTDIIKSINEADKIIVELTENLNVLAKISVQVKALDILDIKDEALADIENQIKSVSNKIETNSNKLKKLQNEIDVAVSKYDYTKRKDIDIKGISSFLNDKTNATPPTLTFFSEIDTNIVKASIPELALKSVSLATEISSIESIQKDLLARSLIYQRMSTHYAEYAEITPKIEKQKKRVNDLKTTTIEMVQSLKFSIEFIKKLKKLQDKKNSVIKNANEKIPNERSLFKKTRFESLIDDSNILISSFIDLKSGISKIGYDNSYQILVEKNINELLEQNKYLKSECELLEGNLETKKDNAVKKIASLKEELEELEVKLTTQSNTIESKKFVLTSPSSQVFKSRPGSEVNPALHHLNAEEEVKSRRRSARVEPGDYEKIIQNNRRLSDAADKVNSDMKEILQDNQSVFFGDIPDDLKKIVEGITNTQEKIKQETSVLAKIEIKPIEKAYKDSLTKVTKKGKSPNYSAQITGFKMELDKFKGAFTSYTATEILIDKDRKLNFINPLKSIQASLKGFIVTLFKNTALSAQQINIANEGIHWLNNIASVKVLKMAFDLLITWNTDLLTIAGKNIGSDNLNKLLSSIKGELIQLQENAVNTFSQTEDKTVSLP